MGSASKAGSAKRAQKKAAPTDSDANKTTQIVNPPAKPDSAKGIQALIDAWNAPREPFNSYVVGVAAAFPPTNLSVSAASQWLDAHEAELWAVLRLGSLDEEALELFDGPPPPKTTWLDLAEATTAGIKGGLDGLKKLKPGESPHLCVLDAIKAVEGPGANERVAALSGATLKHMHEKAKQYKVLNEASLGALRQFAGRKRSGQGLTPRQVAWLHKMLEQLADNGVVTRNSPDRDQMQCDEVLDAIGR